MTDIFSKEKRSEVMSKIRGKNTSVELLVYRYLRRNRVYFQKHYRRAPGSPDVALPRKKKAVFIDGDFWHGKSIDRVSASRGENDFWTKKIRRNIQRDNEQRAELTKLGWQIHAVWESDLKRKSTQQEALNSIRIFLTRK